MPFPIGKSSFRLLMPAKSIVTHLKHVTNARRATGKRQISLSHNLNCGNSTVSAQDAAGSGLAGPVKKSHFHGRCIALTTNECHSFAVKHAWDDKRDRRADCSWARKPGSESIRLNSFWFSSKNQSRDISGGLRGSNWR